MTPTDLSHFRRALLRLKSLLEQAEATAADAAGTVEVDQARVGRLSRMDALQTQQMALENSLVQQSNEAALLVEALSVSRAYLESIIDSMAEVLFVTSPDGSIRMANVLNHLDAVSVP